MIYFLQKRLLLGSSRWVETVGRSVGSTGNECSTFNQGNGGDTSFDAYQAGAQEGVKGGGDFREMLDDSF